MVGGHGEGRGVGGDRGAGSGGGGILDGVGVRCSWRVDGRGVYRSGWG